MSHKSKAEILGNVPINTADTPGHPTGVRAIIDTENVTGAIHNRSLRDIWENADLQDRALRQEVALPYYADLIASGPVTEVELSGRIYTGSAAITPQELFKYFRITDRNNNPLFGALGKQVFVKGLQDPTGGDWVDQKRTIVSGAVVGNVTFSLQTISHTDALLPFSYAQPGDEIVVSGGSPNDGTYIVEEVLGSLAMRVRKSTGTDDAFSPGDYGSLTITVRTNGLFAHKKDGAETFDVRVLLEDTLPDETKYRLHYYVSSTLKGNLRDLVQGASVFDQGAQIVSFQDIVDGKFQAHSTFINGDAQKYTATSFPMRVQSPSTSQNSDAFAAAFRKDHASPGANNAINEFSQIDKGQFAVEFLSAQLIHSITGNMTVDPADTQIITDTTILASGEDLSDIGSGTVESAAYDFAAGGIRPGQRLAIASEPSTMFTITGVGLAAGLANDRRVTVSPTPAPFAPGQEWQVYQVWSQHDTPRLTRGQTLGLVTSGLPGSNQGTMLAGSTTFQDFSQNFLTTGVQAGDLVYVYGSTFNNGVHTVSSVTDANNLVLADAALMTESPVSYLIVNPDVLFGRAFFVTDYFLNQLHGKYFGSFGGDWNTARTQLTVFFFQASVFMNNYIAGATPFLASAKLGVYQGHDGSNLSKGMELLSTAEQFSENSEPLLKTTSRLFPDDVTQGLLIEADLGGGYRNVRVGPDAGGLRASLNVRVGDFLVLKEGLGTNRNTRLLVTEVWGDWCRVYDALGELTSPTPATWPHGFYVERGPNFTIASQGALSVGDLSVSHSKEKSYEIPLSVGNPYKGTSVYEVDLPTGTFQWRATVLDGGFARVAFPIQLEPGDTLVRLEARVAGVSAFVNPNLLALIVPLKQGFGSPVNHSGISVTQPYLAGTYTFTTGSDVVTSSIDLVANNVRPGDFVLVGGTTVLKIAGVLDTTRMVVEGPSLVTGALAGHIIGGRPLDGSPTASVTEWLVVANLNTAEDIDADNVYHLEVNLQEVGAELRGLRVITKTGRL